MASLALGAAELAGPWKYTAPPHPNAKGDRPPAETLYVIKVDGKRFTGTMLVNRGIAEYSERSYRRRPDHSRETGRQRPQDSQ
jgi:hypothetical protein